MTILEQTLDAALCWWQSKRPVRWSLRDHLRYPEIGCTTEVDRRLARCCAALVEARGQKRRRTLPVIGQS